ncbi:MAG TPA: S8 family serine peptidase [Pilimelia sp.]|nr:S8 family serine peptidase [Pilimelia sp.]
MKRILCAGAAATVTGLALVLVVPTPSTAAPAAAASTEYTVVAEDGVAAAAAAAAITAAGGTIVSRNDGVGVFRVVSAKADFASRVAAADALIGASARRPIGYSPRQLERESVAAEVATANGAQAGRRGAASADPLDDRLWGLDMIRAEQARRVEPGERGVRVGILDTGLDASHPDLAPNFSARLSRNFAPDKIDVDGPCEVASCVDPVGTDDNGHGTHVAGTIGAAVNGVGVSGIAPKVTLVGLKSGQDSGYFFLEPVVNALTYAGDAGLDVVNMSFYVDPWLYNCLNNPADSPTAQAEQRAIIRAMSRALTYAHVRGVTLVGSLGNNHEDLGDPRVDTSSPDYGAPPYDRPIDNDTCWDLPVEGPFVIGVSAVGPSGSKADYSNYGVEQTEVAAPGGFVRDFFGTPQFNTRANAILSSYPLAPLQAQLIPNTTDPVVDEAGNIDPRAATYVFRDCSTGTCGYYTYLQGTSMAAPHASGVAALIVSRFGGRDVRRGGVTLLPALVQQHLYRTAAEHACPQPRLRSYVPEGRSVEFDAYCEGGENFNGFYGYGIVDAHAAVTTPLRPWIRP